MSKIIKGPLQQRDLFQLKVQADTLEISCAACDYEPRCHCRPYTLDEEIAVNRWFESIKILDRKIYDTLIGQIVLAEQTQCPRRVAWKIGLGFSDDEESRSLRAENRSLKRNLKELQNTRDALRIELANSKRRRRCCHETQGGEENCPSHPDK